MPVSFVAGDHLRVWRPVGNVGYHHHGIYVSDGRVIQFGGRIRDKRHATIGAVPLAEFENGGTAEIVQHRGNTWFGAPRFDAPPREQAVRRAEWLLANHPDGLYDLFGNNCEQAANFCSTGAHESYQVRGFFFLNGVAGAALMLYVAERHRDGRPPHGERQLRSMRSSGYARCRTSSIYARGARWMKHVGRKWLEYERGGAAPPSVALDCKPPG
jgi:hypothetical protein